jgi:uncharacterized membrane protein YidH (DUF202 family)
MCPDSQALDEAKLILAEKRTHLATLRTGIAVFALPLGVVSFLITFSRHFHPQEVLLYLVPLLAACLGLAALGVCLVWRAWKGLNSVRWHLERLRRCSPVVARDME